MPPPRPALPESDVAEHRPAVLSYQDQRTAKSESRAHDTYFPDRIIDLQLPLVLVVAGIAIEFVAAWLSRSGGAARALSDVGLRLVVGTILMLIAILITARLRGIRIGRFWTAVLKLSAVAIAPSAAITVLQGLLSIVPLGWIVAWGLGFCFYFALLGVFFDLDQDDTWYCLAIIFILNVAVFISSNLLLG